MLLSFLALLAIGSTQGQNVIPAGSHFAPVDVFHSPNMTGAGGWQEALDKANAFLARLNLTEKVGIVTGSTAIPCVGNIAPIPRLNFSGMCLQDGPTAIRIADLASVFPAGITAAASWDRELIYARGRALGLEFRGKGAHAILGHALGGRNWEGFSPDPYLSGVAMEQTIRGIQSSGVQAVAKHYIGNEQETHRGTTVAPDGSTVDALSSNIDDRTIHELYLWPFANAVKAGVASFMCGYNRLNQTYACENSKILNGFLKDELAFQGYVMSDWYATHSGVKSIQAGLDMNMPGDITSDATREALLTGQPAPSYFRGNLTAAITNGSLPESRLDDMVRRVLTPYFFLKQDQGFPSVDPTTLFVTAAAYNQLGSFRSQIPVGVEARDVRSNHSLLIRELGAAGTVLLKNTNNTLPLKAPKTIAVFGGDAAAVAIGLAPQDSAARNPSIGTLMVGGGSGTGRATYIVSPLHAILSRAGKDGTRVQYLLDNQVVSEGIFESIYPLPDICLVFLKSFATENEDRTILEADWNSTTVVNNVARLCSSTIVITHSSGVNIMPWSDNPNVTAILAAHYPGQETGNSIVDVLYGEVNPSGKLPYTIPRNETDIIPILNLTGTSDEFNADAWQADFTEGQFIDYRHVDAEDIEPLYEFGFGLSYTTFNITDPLSVSKLVDGGLSARPAPQPAGQITPGGNPELWEPLAKVNTSVTNTGDVAGATVLQLYLSLPQETRPTGTPLKVLRGFEKVYLQPGESKQITFELLRRDVSYWDVVAQDWVVPAGEVSVSAGFSSRDLSERTAFTLI